VELFARSSVSADGVLIFPVAREVLLELGDQALLRLDLGFDVGETRPLRNGLRLRFRFPFTSDGLRRSLRPPVPFLTRLHVFRPAAVVAADRAVFDGERPLGDRVDESAIVRDDEDGSLELLERRLQDLAALEVEVVRGLVEDEEVRARLDQERKAKPSALATRELADRLTVLVPAGEPETAQ
jgi:hypothetical protein